jgi:carbamoyl-phosphate synthase small subunit
VVREYCPHPSHRLSKSTLNDYLVSGCIPGISGIDTRSLTRHIRSLGVMPAVISTELTVAEAVSSLKTLPLYGSTDFVKEVSAPAQYHWQGDVKNEDAIKIVIVDMGLRYNIARIFDRLGCAITVVPCTASAAEIRKLSPDGVVLSPGPGDPALLDYLIENIRQLLGQVPVMGVCLGHQLVGRALGADTFKLKFGHRGGNHPVRDLESGRIYITTQNHGYALGLETLTGGLEASHVSLNDGTVEGLRHKEIPLISIQYHAEGSPGPQDSNYLFQKFLDLIRQGKRK